jgi:site-specific recombinase XerD
VDGVTSMHSRRAYEKGLRQFFAWCRDQSRDQPRASFSKSLANAYRSWLLAQGLAPSTINLRLSPVRKLAREMADNHLLDHSSL